MDARHTPTPGKASPTGSDSEALSPVKKALVEIRRLNRELQGERGRRRQPVAVVGMGLRFPGGVSRTEDLDRLLRDGREAVGPIPRDRWDHDAYYQAGEPSPGSYYVDRGGFLGGVDLFDPEFFGIAPLEASSLDPQQRLLLETTWEALEDAAIPAGSLRGSPTGVFLGMGTTDYHRAVLADPGAIDTYASTGTAFSVASGRISYILDLHGPALSVDTACSSSLVAVHLACQSLRSGESDLALAGGVSLMLSPEVTINFCQAGMLSPDGRCKTFDASADGYVRSEGCGVVVLKRLEDALRDGDRVLAVVRGSAVNQDGRSSGLTAPNGPAQEAVLRAALTNAGLTPDDVGYVEAHGTGTSLGDPIEVQSLGAVFSGGERSAPLRIGSAKTNFGHLEAAAGVAGLMKAILALRNGSIPPHLHLRTPNPHIPWDDFDLEVPTTATPLEPTGGARRAGVSSFGFSGTNAHVILEEPPEVEAPQGGDPDRPLHILTLSAPHDDGLKALAGRYVAHLQDTSSAFPDVCFTANSGRTHFHRRIAVVAGDAEEAARSLSAWIEGREAPGLFTGDADRRGRDGATAFVFPASAPVVSALHPAPPAVRRSLDAWGDSSSVAGQHALAELWTAWGIPPHVVTAQGVGHRAAGVAAGLVGVSEVSGADAGPEADTAHSKPRLRYLVAHPGDGGGPESVVVADEARWREVATGGSDAAAPWAVLRAEGIQRVMVMGPSSGLDLPEDLLVVSASDGPLDWEELLSGLARLYVSGVDPDWRRVEEGYDRVKVSLPSYPFQRRRFWLEEGRGGSATGPASGAAVGSDIARASEADPWTSASEAAFRRAGWAPLDLNLASYPAKWSALNRLTRGVGRNVLAGLGVFDEAGATADVDGILENYGVLPVYRQIVRRWLDDLAEDGALRTVGDGWEAPAPLESVELAPLWDRVEETLQDNLALLAYVRNSAAKAQGVLTGRISALETLFPDGSFDLASELYESATQLRYVNGIAAAALDAFASARPAQAPLRVLEVGAGTGGTTSSLVPVLPADLTRYDYTDVSDVFLDWGARKFASVPFVRTVPFDLEHPVEEQGFEPGGYDVVVGSNVLHAVRDLPAALERVRSLLAPGGMLLLVESTGHLPWHDITTGLIEGWQRFEDDLRSDTPLLPVTVWHELLDQAGFRASTASPLAGSPAGVLEQHVIMAVVEGDSGYTRGQAADVDDGLSLDAPMPAGAPDDVPSDGATAPPGASGGTLTDRLADAIGEEREEIVVDAVRGCVMEVLRSDPDRPPSKDARLMELGLDSLMAVRLRNLLQTRLGLDGGLPSTLVFDHPTIRHISALVLRLVSDDEAAGPAPDAEVPAEEHDRRRQVADLSDEEAEARLLERLERGDL